MAAVRDGKIGEPRIFHSRFCQQAIPGNSRLQDELGGEPLYDIGGYCINAARYRFRTEPETVFAYAAERFKEIDEVSAALLRFPDASLAGFTCSFSAADRSTFEVIGTKGVVKMDPAYGTELVEQAKRNASEAHQTR